MFQEYDYLFDAARLHQFVDGRRLMQTILWATITYYGTVVYFYLCFGEQELASLAGTIFPSLDDAIEQVLKLALKLHKNRPRIMIRVVWPLFMAGIATRDEIYQDWVSIRLKELGRCGINFSHISEIYNNITQENITKRLSGKEKPSLFLKNIRETLRNVRGENFLL
jgi:hypothetical protein